MPVLDEHEMLGDHGKPMGLLNTAGYFDPLLAFVERSEQAGFLWPDVKQLMLLGQDLPTLLDQLYAAARHQAGSTA